MVVRFPRWLLAAALVLLLPASAAATNAVGNGSFGGVTSDSSGNYTFPGTLTLLGTSINIPDRTGGANINAGFSGYYQPFAFEYGSASIAGSNTTTTTATFTMTAEGGNVASIAVAASAGFSTFTFYQISDGTHIIDGYPTTIIDGTHIDFTTVTILAGAAGNTMGNGATIRSAITSVVCGSDDGSNLGTLLGIVPSFLGCVGNDAPGIRLAMDKNGNAAFAGTVAGGAPNGCTATSGTPCRIQAACTLTSQTNCTSPALAVPAGSYCAGSYDSTSTASPTTDFVGMVWSVSALTMKADSSASISGTMVMDLVCE